MEQGKDVAFLTLGDSSIYATPMYLHRILKEKGYQTKMVPGIPSFCAVAASWISPSAKEGNRFMLSLLRIWIWIGRFLCRGQKC